MADQALAFAEHDHHRCRKTLLDELARAARRRGLRLTPARLRVLELLSEAHRAMGAYELLDRLRAAGLGSQPPVVYRALDFLISAGFAHKLERSNAYVACSHPGGDPGSDHAACFLICAGCRKVAEIEDATLDLAVAQAAARRGFAMRRTVLEIEGTCPSCRGAA
ncbi:MAG TPA: transcriptional repressor [Thermohalobaculum sp.]|nr:transcriptional repressor [Thermohalobaculum sp.]